MKHSFPFSSELKKVDQIDKSPKKVFVLGVYASAVHAKWIGADGKVKVTALAVVFLRMIPFVLAIPAKQIFSQFNSWR